GKTALIERILMLKQEKIKPFKKEPTYSLKIYGTTLGETPFYFIDTPGDENFIGETLWAMAVADLGVLVVDSTSPLKYNLYRIFEKAREIKIPLIAFVNKLDGEKTQWAQTICDMQDLMEIPQIPLIYGFNTTHPLYLVDLIEKKAIKEEGLKISYEEIPSHYNARLQTLVEQVMEIAAEAKDEFIEKYLGEGTLSKEEIIEGLKMGIQSQKIVPIFLGSALSGLGVSFFLKKLEELCPEREDLKLNINSPYGYIFKTYYDPYAGKISIGRLFKGSFKPDGYLYTSRGKEEKYTQIFVPKGDNFEPVKEIKEGEIVLFTKVEGLKTGDTFSTEPIIEALGSPQMPNPMYTLALHPETRADEDKISAAIGKLNEEDTSLYFYRNEETRELLVSGIGPLHLEKTIEKLKEKYGVKVKVTLPKVPYRETLKKPVKAVIYRHKKQTGGRGQFAEVHFHVYPLERGRGFEFIETLTGMNVPRNFVPAVEKGVREALEKGLLAGYPVVDVRVEFYDGKSHEVDSSDMAFKIAAFHCFKKAMEQANP
ncbi:MAG: GTP-binding protein, partial [Caldimicrobium sp.]